MQLSDVVAGYWLDRKLALSVSTQKTYAHWFKLLIAFLDDKAFDKITTSDIKTFFAHLLEEKELSRRSVHDSWIPLSSLWTWAENELKAVHIIREGKIKPLKFTEKPIEPFSQDELQKLVSGAGFTTYRKNGKTVRMKRATADRDVAIILALVDGGLRATELCNLKIADYDANRGRLHIIGGKGDKDRFVFLGSRAQKAIWKMMIGRKGAKPNDPLFAAKSIKRLDRNNLRHLVQTIAKRVGVSNAHPHRFRHTFAITFLRNGGNVAELQQILGHKSVEMSLHYARVAEVDLEQAAKKYSPADLWRL
jgi:integrase/recombinase XerD